MAIGHRRTSRSIAAGLVVLVLVGASVAGCGAGTRTTPPHGGFAPGSGFPLGSFAKELDDPQVGRVRLVWTFEADGRWAEIPLAVDGQSIDIPPIRGTWTADGETVTIATTYPPGIGTSTHGWRLDRDDVWTWLVASDNPDDQEWFQDLDSRPWVPYG